MKKNLNPTILKSVEVVKFRGLEDLQIELGKQVTLICGKNGTSKSSLLGIAAQIFSFEEDPLDGKKIEFRTITGKQFKSAPREHFRFSQTYDGPSSMAVNFSIYDGYSESNYDSSLELTTRTTDGIKKSRPVVRGNTSDPSKDNESRNYTHPVIYLSLKRLMPITERARYSIQDYEYLTKNRSKFLGLNNELLNKLSTATTGTQGTINSAVAFGSDYDQDSVSTGEDNAGQIILALMSFRKLKDEYSNYRGGLLLIDEADAGLFPAAQLKLLEILHRECNDLGIQVILTSHSPTMIEKVFNLSKKFSRNFRTLYLTDTFGPVSAKNDFSWSQIYADIHTTTIQISKESSLPEVSVYFEDSEAQDFYAQIMLRQPAKKITKVISDVSLGCDNYLQLIRAKVPEFAKKSLVILDADAESKAAGFATVAVLPGELPPDQLIFEYLYNLPADDSIWNNAIQFTRRNFTNAGSEIINELQISSTSIALKSLISTRAKNKEEKKTLRKVFKNFYNNDEFKSFLKQTNPWKRWVQEHPSEVASFRQKFNQKLSNVVSSAYGIDPAVIATLLPVDEGLAKS